MPSSLSGCSLESPLLELSISVAAGESSNELTSTVPRSRGGFRTPSFSLHQPFGLALLTLAASAAKRALLPLIKRSALTSTSVGTTTLFLTALSVLPAGGDAATTTPQHARPRP